MQWVLSMLYYARRDIMRRKNKPVLLIFILSIIGISIWIYKVLPNFKTIVGEKAFEEFHTGQINVVMGNNRISLVNPMMIKEGNLYFPITFVQKHISQDVFWDEDEDILTITNTKEMIRIKPGKETYEINYKKYKMNNTIEVKNNIVYIPYELLEEKYNIVATYNQDTNIVIIDDTTVDRVIGIVKANTTKVRTEPNIKSPILQTLYKDEHVMTYGNKNGWTQVRTLEGNIGYINQNHVQYLKEMNREAIKEYQAPPIQNPIEDKIVMVWDQIGKNSKPNFNSSKYTDMSGVNVISPTWLEFADEKGNLNTHGDKEYVKWAHSQGYRVWPLMSHNFSNSKWTHEILSSTDKRDRVIEQLVSFVRKYNVDGINIDIENLEERTGPYWIQFMRELYPIMRGQGVAVSTDIYVPSPWSMHYNRSEIAKVVDYFIIMAYDEHWSGSESAGSVGSLPWVQLAIERTLDEVPAEKVILGVPFYARVWGEGIDENGEFTLSSRALGMDGVQKELERNEAVPIWDEQVGQYYAEYENEGRIYKVWIEDKESMETRASLVNQYNLAGISGWKLGLETPDIWEVIQYQIRKKE